MFGLVWPQSRPSLAAASLSLFVKQTPRCCSTRSRKPFIHASVDMGPTRGMQNLVLCDIENLVPDQIRRDNIDRSLLAGISEIFRSNSIDPEKIFLCLQRGVLSAAESKMDLVKVEGNKYEHNLTPMVAWAMLNGKATRAICGPTRALEMSLIAVLAEHPCEAAACYDPTLSLEYQQHITPNVYSVLVLSLCRRLALSSLFYLLEDTAEIRSDGRGNQRAMPTKANTLIVTNGCLIEELANAIQETAKSVLHCTLSNEEVKVKLEEELRLLDDVKTSHCTYILLRLFVLGAPMLACHILLGIVLYRTCGWIRRQYRDGTVVEVGPQDWLRDMVDSEDQSNGPVI